MYIRVEGVPLNLMVGSGHFSGVTGDARVTPLWWDHWEELWPGPAGLLTTEVCGGAAWGLIASVVAHWVGGLLWWYKSSVTTSLTHKEVPAADEQREALKAVSYLSPYYRCFLVKFVWKAVENIFTNWAVHFYSKVVPRLYLDFSLFHTWHNQGSSIM